MHIARGCENIGVRPLGEGAGGGGSRGEADSGQDFHGYREKPIGDIEKHKKSYLSGLGKEGG